jgi:hypothetical protein
VLFYVSPDCQRAAPASRERLAPLDHGASLFLNNLFRLCKKRLPHFYYADLFMTVTVRFDPSGFEND